MQVDVGGDVVTGLAITVTMAASLVSERKRWIDGLLGREKQKENKEDYQMWSRPRYLIFI